MRYKPIEIFFWVYYLSSNYLVFLWSNKNIITMFFLYFTILYFIFTFLSNSRVFLTPPPSIFPIERVPYSLLISCPVLLSLYLSFSQMLYSLLVSLQVINILYFINLTCNSDKTSSSSWSCIWIIFRIKSSIIRNHNVDASFFSKRNVKCRTSKSSRPQCFSVAVSLVSPIWKEQI